MMNVCPTPSSTPRTEGPSSSLPGVRRTRSGCRWTTTASASRDPADRARIFERFYRVDKARSRESGGTGLGLSIAKELVDRHQGVLELVDRPGPGLSIRMTLPIGGPHHDE